MRSGNDSCRRHVPSSAVFMDTTAHRARHGGRIHGAGFVFPCAWKTKVMYKNVLGIIQQLVGADLHNPWVFDMETSMVHEHRAVMSESTAVGCFFSLHESN